MKKLFWFWFWLAVGVAAALWYSRLPESKKRYLGYVAGQAPAMVARYFV